MKKLLFLVPAIALASCQPEGEEHSPAQPDPAPEAPAEPAIDVSKTDTLIGQPLEKVEAACDAAGVKHRIIRLDGESRMVTKDFLPDRLNFVVEKGLVTEVTKG